MVMSERQYDGTPIDLTWNNGPWANDGETVDATDSETGEIQTTMTAEKSSDTLTSESINQTRQLALNGATTREIARKIGKNDGTVSKMLRGADSYGNYNCKTPPLEFTSDGPDGEWVIADGEEHTTETEATEDTTTTTDTEPPTYHPPERDSNRRLAYGVALVALVSYALGKLRGGD